MAQTRKKLYIAVLLNFFVGIAVGIILFYAQMRSGNSLSEGEFTYDATVEIADFFRISWLNLLWIFSFFIAHNIMPSQYFHPIMIIRGCSNSFSAMYMLNFIGIKETALLVIPQCLSILLLLVWGSVVLAEKRVKKSVSPATVLTLSRGETLMIFLLATLCAAAEIFFFRAFYAVLF